MKSVALVLTVILAMTFFASCAEEAPAQGPAFSNATLKGTYVVSTSGTVLAGPGSANGVATLTFDGAGQITGGALADYESSTTSPSVPCTGTFTGVYSVGSTGSFTSTLNVSWGAENPNNNCPYTGTDSVIFGKFVGIAKQDGSGFVIVESDGDNSLSGVGLLQ